MALIKWQPTFNLNIAIIDEQHKLLVDLINELSEAYTSNKDRKILEKLINKLGVYASMHFAREEHYFEHFGYPDMDAHLKEHDHFDDMITQFEDEFVSGKEDLSITILLFLSEWLVGHINDSDKKYVPYLKARGV